MIQARWSAALLAALFAATAATAQAPQSVPATATAKAAAGHPPLPKPASQNGIDYVSGGVGTDAAAAMKEMAAKYNTQLRFAAAPAGNYLVDVNVKIIGASGHTRFELAKAGPILLAHLPPGTYDVIASYEGKEQKRRITVGSGDKRANEGFSW